MGKKKNVAFNNLQFVDSAWLNSSTFLDYLERFKKLALSIFEWVNLPPSMNARFLEQSLYYDGMASLLKDKNYGLINTRCCSDGNLNIYHLPTRLQCYSYDYETNRSLYTGLPKIKTDAMLEYMQNNECILVPNNWDMTPTAGSMELFAVRLAECDRVCDVNLKAQKTPVMIIVDERQRAMMENLYSQYDGNRPYIFGDSKQMTKDMLQAIKTDAPFVIDKVTDYKKEIWNEALTYLGINNILVDKKERLITDEANSNNELINLNLQAMLAPRQEACRQFNEKFGLTGTDKEISVRVRSDLHNIIKNVESIVADYKEDGIVDDIKNIDVKEGVSNE